MVASTVPARTNWPVSTVRVLMMPATWGRTSERCRFCLAIPRAAFATSTDAAPRRAFSPCERVSSSTDRRSFWARASRRLRSAPARSCSARDCSSTACARSASSRYRSGSIRRSTVPGPTRSPSRKRTSVATPSTSAVTWTMSRASIWPSDLIW